MSPAGISPTARRPIRREQTGAPSRASRGGFERSSMWAMPTSASGRPRRSGRRPVLVRRRPRAAADRRSGSSRACRALVQPAAGVEAAARRRVDGARHVALEDDPPPLALGGGIRHGHGRQQRPGVRVARAGVERVRRPDLDDLAEVHHRDAVADVLHDRQVVGDEQVRQPEPLAQVLSRLRTCAWIETSRAETGSSQTMNSGSTASARAMPMRWRWPPENSCG